MNRQARPGWYISKSSKRIRAIECIWVYCLSHKITNVTKKQERGPGSNQVRSRNNGDKWTEARKHLLAQLTGSLSIRAYARYREAAMGEQMLQRIASNLSNCILHHTFVSDTEVASVSVSRSLDDPIKREGG